MFYVRVINFEALGAADLISLQPEVSHSPPASLSPGYRPLKATQSLALQQTTRADQS